jgi:hypothetical protein
MGSDPNQFMTVSTKPSNPAVAVVAKTRIVFCRLPASTYDRLTTRCAERSERLSDGIRAAVVAFLASEDLSVDQSIESLRQILQQLLPKVEQLSKMVLEGQPTPARNYDYTELLDDQEQRDPE